VEGGGGKGVQFLGFNVFFIVEWLGRDSPGVIFFYKFMGGGKGRLKVATQGFRVH